jgi:hypothetical protein
MKGLSRKNFSQAGRRLIIWFSAASHSRFPERLNYRCHSRRIVAQVSRDLSTPITGQPVHSTLPKLLNSDSHSSY